MDWQGDERRSIPIHILNHIDDRIEEQTDKLDGRISAVQMEVHHLSNSIQAWMAKEPDALLVKCEKLIDEAIPAHPDSPNSSPAEKRHEHRRAHAAWIQNVTEEVARWKRIREKALEWAVVGGLGIILIAVWQYLLKGPQ